MWRSIRRAEKVSKEKERQKNKLHEGQVQATSYPMNTAQSHANVGGGHGEIDKEPQNISFFTKLATKAKEVRGAFKKGFEYLSAIPDSDLRTIPFNTNPIGGN